MTVQRFAAVIGTLFLAVGILGFIPAFRSPGPGEGIGATVQTGYGYLLGLFAVNVLHNFVHLGVGIWGLVASGTMLSAIRFARGLAIFYGVLAVMGLIPGLNTLFGLAPLFGHDVWLHAGTALLSAYYGYYWTPAAVEVDRRETRRAA
ncbi:DUF4383 domain-containing protein [Nitrospira moscoviensis]|uniref:DUF4383 domain-containing protein n=1 Tax=Nitrospira moscoviensis TaxID=42253 RepID=A0A0K2GF30_NITMO|nr:DUF4383 domain-containing protein [Nitrospira moscoviensis]ALA59217.1 conserved membrane protein of unknown function [Nitrospira moscoviensis]